MTSNSSTLSNVADAAVIGGGILGLAHAWVLVRRGMKVVLFERNARASGASIRNFGMIWPIGQPAGEMHALALRSREIWLEMLAAAKLPYLPTGSLHVAHRADEAAVLREFAEIGPAAGYSCQWLEPAEVLARSPAVRPEDLQGGIWSDTETTVDPRRIAAELPAYLEEMGVILRYGMAVKSIELPVVRTATEVWHVDRAVVCSGDDFATLYPEIFATSGLTRCKLQMMRTVQQASRPAAGSWVQPSPLDLRCGFIKPSASVRRLTRSERASPVRCRNTIGGRFTFWSRKQLTAQLPWATPTNTGST